MRGKPGPERVCRHFQPGLVSEPRAALLSPSPNRDSRNACRSSVPLMSSGVGAEAPGIPPHGDVVGAVRPAAVRDVEWPTQDLGGRRLEDVAIVVGLNELALVSRWATGSRAGRRSVRFVDACRNVLDQLWFGDERDQPDVAATPRPKKGDSSPTRASTP